MVEVELCLESAEIGCRGLSHFAAKGLTDLCILQYYCTSYIFEGWYCGHRNIMSILSCILRHHATLAIIQSIYPDHGP